MPSPRESADAGRLFLLATFLLSLPLPSEDDWEDEEEEVVAVAIDDSPLFVLFLPRAPPKRPLPSPLALFLLLEIGLFWEPNEDEDPERALLRMCGTVGAPRDGSSLPSFRLPNFLLRIRAVPLTPPTPTLSRIPRVRWFLAPPPDGLLLVLLVLLLVFAAFLVGPPFVEEKDDEEVEVDEEAPLATVPPPPVRFDARGCAFA